MGTVADYSHGEPPPMDSEGPSMHDLVIADIEEYMGATSYNGFAKLQEVLRERQEFGIEKYNKPLRANNGRDPLNDLIDELGDALVYCKQFMAEMHSSERDGFVNFYWSLVEAAGFFCRTRERKNEVDKLNEKLNQV